MPVSTAESFEPSVPPSVPGPPGFPLLLLPQATKREVAPALTSQAQTEVKRRVRFDMGELSTPNSPRAHEKKTGRRARSSRQSTPPGSWRPRQSPKLTLAGQLPGLGSPFIFPRILATQSAFPAASLLAVATPAARTLPPGPT